MERIFVLRRVRGIVWKSECYNDIVTINPLDLRNR